ncbi:hypothetical protein [Streptomyces sp. NPDC017524]|uniref:hypothetical protein n=1 Tax=unclassified Streptomyces TaxID=2593676 RepID=UPI0037BB94DD
MVRMAVGHARPDERAPLLTSLLRRAGAEAVDEHRLILPAAASLARAPEPDPEVRERGEGRTEGLLPPDSQESVNERVTVDGLASELLSSMLDGLTEHAAEAVVRTASAVGGALAYDLVKQCRDDDRSQVVHELSAAREGFEPEQRSRGTDLAHLAEPRRRRGRPRPHPAGRCGSADDPAGPRHPVTGAELFPPERSVRLP